MQKTPDDIIVFLVVTIFLIILLGSFIITILFLYQKKQMIYLKELEKIKSDYEKNLLKTHIEIQEQTFQAISRDIHDNINLSLTLAKLNLNTLDLADIEKSDQVISSIEFISKAIIDLTDISRSMNSDVISEQGLIRALELEIEKLKKLKCFFIKFEVSGNPVFMDANKELVIFRIIQESFNNILKHAQARQIQLFMHYNLDHVEITASDDGVGFNKPTKKESHGKARPTSGLLNMRKRAEILNGSFHINSHPGLGTIIKISIPY